jgi:hypothetical protein
VFAPAAGSDYRWPHVEQAGLLCLRPSRNTAPISERIALHLNDAEELLNYDEVKRQEEFKREFVAYWRHRATTGTSVLSLVAPHGPSRKVFYLYFHVGKTDCYLIADDKTLLNKWLRNIGTNPRDKDIFSTWLFSLEPNPWLPKDFPETSDDVIRLLPQHMVRQCLKPGMRRPFLFEANTVTGPAFAAVVLPDASYKEVVKGFRHISKVPLDRIVNMYAKRPVERCNVSRVDGAWIHGRDHSSSYAEIKGRKIAIVGCGAIGSALSRLMTQAGVGETMLVDGDTLSTANISRHILGIEYVGFNNNKAIALQNALRRQFPHLTFEHAFPTRFEQLSSKDLDHLASVDIIIAAGIDFDGEAALDTWRRSLPCPPAYISTWVEAYAIVGHAVLLYGHRSILKEFEADERPNFRLTDWPDEAGTLIVEAGCGNSFQPHDVVDLHPTVGMAARLVLDTLLNKAPTSCRRVWMGDPDVVKNNGGILRSTFSDRLTMREFAWP